MFEVVNANDYRIEIKRRCQISLSTKIQKFKVAVTTSKEGRYDNTERSFLSRKRKKLSSLLNEQLHDSSIVTTGFSQAFYQIHF